MPDLPTQINELGSVADGLTVADEHMNDVRRLLELLSIGHFGLWPPPLSGELTTGLYNGTPLSGGVVASANIWAVPFVLPVARTFDALVIQVTTAAGGSQIRLGLYTDAGSRPATLIEEPTSGTQIDSSTTGLKTASFGAARSLLAGIYWLAIHNSTNAIQVQRSDTAAAAAFALIGSGDTNAAHAAYASRAYQAMPATFPAASLSTNAPPRTLMRVA